MRRIDLHGGRSSADLALGFPPEVGRLHLTEVAALDQARLAAYERLLAEDERSRLRRLRFERLRREYLATRGLVRLVLGAYAGVDPARLQFEAGRWGKPAIVAPRAACALSFNVSNTDGMVALLVARERDVGVDVERIDRASDAVSTPDQYLSPLEAAALLRQPAGRRRERFFVYWTLKEAYLKARGTGLNLPLDAFSFDLAGDDGDGGGGGGGGDGQRAGRIAVSFAPPIEDDPGAWQFGCVAAPPRHRVAWAIRHDGRALPVEIISTVP